MKPYGNKPMKNSSHDSLLCATGLGIGTLTALAQIPTYTGGVQPDLKIGTLPLTVIGGRHFASACAAMVPRERSGGT
jgi:hypothetical protein